MNRFTAFLIAGAMVAVSTAAEAQRNVAAKDVPPGHRPPRGMCRVWVDGVPPGRQAAPTDCATARATAPLNSRIIYGDLTPFPGQGRNRVARDCTFERTRTTLGDVIFGRRAADRDVECRTRGSRELGAWYEIGRDANGNVIYQRRVRQSDGTIVLQRARRLPNGTLEVFDTRFPRGTRGDDGDDDRNWSRAERRAAKQARKAERRAAKDARKEARRLERNETSVRAPGLDVARERVRGTPAEPTIVDVRARVSDDANRGRGNGNGRGNGKGKGRGNN